MNQSTVIFLSYLHMKASYAQIGHFVPWTCFADYRADWLRLMGE
jgi:hypothetical protein